MAKIKKAMDDAELASAMKKLQERYFKFPLAQRRQMIQTAFPSKRGSLLLCANCLNVYYAKGESDPCTVVGSYSYPITKKSIMEWAKNNASLNEGKEERKGWKSYLTDEQNRARMNKVIEN